VVGAVALDLQPGTEAPRNLDAPQVEWDVEIHAVNRVACDGRIEEQLARSFSGPGAVGLRATTAGMNVEDRERWLIEEYRSVMGEKTEPEITHSTEKGETERLFFLSKTVYEGGQPLEGLSEYNEADAWLVHYAQRFRPSNRHHPYFVPGVRITSTSLYHLCATRAVAFFGAKLEMESEFGTLRRRWERHHPDDVRVVTVLELPRQTVATGDLERFRRFLDVTLAQTPIWLGLGTRSVRGGGS
jgi:hypothetical protein